MLNCRLVCVVALVLVVGAQLCSSNLVPWGKTTNPLAVYTDLNGVTICYKPKELSNILGFSLRDPRDVARILAATSDKNKPNTIANRYSINDLLAINKVYAKDFTPEKFNARLAMCESLSPEHGEEPASDSVDENYHQVGWRHNMMDKGDRVYIYNKNLHNYCVEAFSEYYRKLRQGMRVDEELDSRVKQLETEVDTFRRKHLMELFVVRPSDSLHAHFIMKDFLKEKQPEEVERIKASCSELIDKVGFVAERELSGHEIVPLRYSLVYTYCKGVFYGGS